MTSKVLNALADYTVLLKWIAFLIAAFGFVWSMQLFIAGNAYYSVKNSIEIWQLSPDKASTKKVNNALGKIDRALNYFPNNALYYQIQGQLFEWKVIAEAKAENLDGVSTGPTNKAINLQNAAKSYEQSLNLRPSWSGSWIGLASVKRQQGELDNQFYGYLESANRAGPQDAILHKFIVDFGLQVFSARSFHYVKIKEKLKHHLNLGIENPLSRDFVLKTIQKHNASEAVCRWLRDASYPVKKRIPNCIIYN